MLQQSRRTSSQVPACKRARGYAENRRSNHVMSCEKENAELTLQMQMQMQLQTDPASRNGLTKRGLVPRLQPSCGRSGRGWGVSDDVAPAVHLVWV